jgi:hypothetical protein
MKEYLKFKDPLQTEINNKASLAAILPHIYFYQSLKKGYQHKSIELQDCSCNYQIQNNVASYHRHETGVAYSPSQQQH